jgi:hypothetical protein
VSIDGYGLFNLHNVGTLWFACDADIVVWHDGQEVFRDHVYWQAQKRSADVPPPRGATLAEFARDDGKPTREMLIEAGDVLAAVALKRLEVQHD